MTAKTKCYVYPSVTVTFVAFEESVEVGSVYGITELSNGSVFINSAEYPYHYELADTEITVSDNGTAYQIYTSEVE